MGIFDTYTIPCPNCLSLVQEQKKPGNMDQFVFGKDPRTDMDFAGFYTCYSCRKSFTVELESIPKMVIKVVEE